jgi:hypothetical protein
MHFSVRPTSFAENPGMAEVLPVQQIEGLNGLSENRRKASAHRLRTGGN